MRQEIDAEMPRPEDDPEYCPACGGLCCEDDDAAPVCERCEGTGRLWADVGYCDCPAGDRAYRDDELDGAMCAVSAAEADAEGRW